MTKYSKPTPKKILHVQTRLSGMSFKNIHSQKKGGPKLVLVPQILHYEPQETSAAVNKCPALMCNGVFTLREKRKRERF